MNHKLHGHLLEYNTINGAHTCMEEFKFKYIYPYVILLVAAGRSG